MICTESGLKTTQEMLVKMERELDRLRREIKPFNEQQYNILSQGILSHLRQMREEIDEYLGIVPFSDSVPVPQVPALV
jgi:hypothetical protein